MTTKIQTFGGNIGIGTNDPGAFKLNVNGSLKTSSLVVNGVSDAQVPIGLIQLWHGSLATIPSGWALCDGNSYTRTDGEGSITTPDLRTKFIRGATGDAPSPVAVGTGGGSNTAALQVANLAPHTHGISVSQANTPHDHGTSGTANAPHNHGLADNETPHSHSVATTQVNHNHGLPAANAPHSHPDFAEGGAAHNHNIGEVQLPAHTHRRPNMGLTGPSPRGVFFFPRTVQSWRNNNLNSGTNNLPHRHVLDTTPGQNHHHNTSGSSMPHRHEITPNNTQHSHSATGSNNMPHSHTIGEGGVQHGHGLPSQNVNAPHSHSASSNNTGQATAFSVLNKYYALFYIMKI